MQLVDTLEALNAAKSAYPRDTRWGLVPTMGALHAGHMALVEAAKAQCDAVLVTIFLNPKQFAAGEDLDRYPQDLATDRAKLAAAGVDLLLAPQAATLYPPNFSTRVSVGALGEQLEGTHRPGFFDGVATVVTKLLALARADLAFFGEKDYQQLLVIKRLASDLNLGTQIVGCPTVRDLDGLALSSRNSYLSAQERLIAPGLARTLGLVLERWQSGDKEAEAWGLAELRRLGFVPDYLVVRDAATLGPPDTDPVRALAAATLGTTRLIDNRGP